MVKDTPYASPIKHIGDDFNIYTNRNLLLHIPIYTTTPLHAEDTDGTLIPNIAVLNFHVSEIYGCFTALMFNGHHYILDHHRIIDGVVNPGLIKSYHDKFISIIEDHDFKTHGDETFIDNSCRLSVLKGIIQYLNYILKWDCHIPSIIDSGRARKVFKIYEATLSTLREFTRFLHRFDTLKEEIDSLGNACSEEEYILIIAKLFNADFNSVNDSLILFKRK